MAKEPTFKLYRICNKENGKAFSSMPGAVTQWGATGTFFRSPETIRKWLKWITHNRENFFKEYPNGHRTFSCRMTTEIPGEIDKLYVECYSVIQQSKHTEEAAVYLGRSNTFPKAAWSINRKGFPHARTNPKPQRPNRRNPMAIDAGRQDTGTTPEPIPQTQGLCQSRGPDSVDASGERAWELDEG